MSLIVYGVQIDCVWEDKEANFAKVRSLLAAASLQPGGLIVLPEMFGTGFSANITATLESEGGLTEQFLKELAATYNCAVIGGLVTSGNNGIGRNQALAVAPDGSTLARYTKMHPFTLGGESAVHEQGSEPVIFEWSGLKISPFICYDLRFPELTRMAIGKGAEVLVYIAAWPIKRQQHWITLLQARAIENQAYLVGVNLCGTDPQFTYPGRSMVVDPQGVIRADAADQEGVVHAEIIPSAITDWRLQFPALRDAGLI